MRPRLKARVVLSAAGLLSLTPAAAFPPKQSVIDSSAAPALGPTETAAWHRGPEIFNAVHNAMRQWGSSLDHNGMSLFLAHVPEGVLLHHGNDSPKTPLDRPEWVAFEIEHAEQFASPMAPDDDGDLPGGYLHTYRTTRPMTFLYIDGMAAADSGFGTADMQQYILHEYNDEQAGERHQPLDRRPDDHGATAKDDDDDFLRDEAGELCALCEQWGLQGVIRMEAGFEIIKCDFSDGFEQVQALQRPAVGPRDEDDGEYPEPPPPGDGPGFFGSFGSLEYLRGMSERYNDIGAGRVVLDYSSMVSAFFFPVNLTNPDPTRQDLPRLVEVTRDERDAIRQHLNRTITERHRVRRRKDAASQTASMNWQGVSDLIVGRYADRIRFMAEKIDDFETMAGELEFLLTLFIDYSPAAAQQRLDLEAATQRCTKFYLPSNTSTSGGTTPTEADRLLHVAFTRVSGVICVTLFRMRTIVTDAATIAPAEAHTSNPSRAAATVLALVRARALAAELIATLRWPRFKMCRPGCGLGEVCVVPMYPMGTVGEYEAPRCKDRSDPGLRDGDAAGRRYWDDDEDDPTHPPPPPGWEWDWDEDGDDTDGGMRKKGQEWLMPQEL